MKTLLTVTISSLMATFCMTVAAASFVTAGEVAPGCGKLDNPFGPFDYRVNKKELALVERHHFSSNVEYLRDKNAGSSIDYTLRAFPNHHRALMSMMNLGFGQKKPKVYGATYSVECYMIRAEQFRPDDALVKVVFGLFLLKAGQQGAAVQKLEAAKGLRSNDPNISYNMGLAYFDLGQFDKALENAHEAYRLGFPLPGLKQKLVKAGKWTEPEQASKGDAPAAGATN